MTREEKISRLKDILAEINEDKDAVCYLTSEDNELIESAIEALEQQPCEDCISRQVAIDAILKIHPVDTEYDCTLYDKVDVMYVLKSLPPVNPQEPKTGHWMWACSIIPSTPVSPEEIDYCGWVCSECKQFPDDNDWDDPDEPPHYRHCPNCGCPMESEDKK